MSVNPHSKQIKAARLKGALRHPKLSDAGRKALLDRLEAMNAEQERRGNDFAAPICEPEQDLSDAQAYVESRFGSSLFHSE